MRIIPKSDDKARPKFVRGALTYLAVQAAHQRNLTFAKAIGDIDAARKRLRNDLYRRLQSLEGAYQAGGVSDGMHLAKIVQLADDMTIDHADTLHGNRYRIGTAQKALNLYLKYLWSAGWIAEPPHCPFDSQIIGKLGKVPTRWRNWTTVDDPEAYTAWVGEAREVAGDLSLARWELGAWNPS